MNINNINNLLKFCILVAGHNDPSEQELGPIHLVKYVYLADLLYAERHEGQTYTGVDWRFHNYGPWSLDVFNRIEPVMEEIGATKKIIESQRYENDMIRWKLNDEDLFEELDNELPVDMALRLTGLIRKYGSYTSDLLHLVYTTEPMLRAAPGERLSFEDLEYPSIEFQESASIPREGAQRKKQPDKIRKEKVQALKEKVREKIAVRKERKRLVPATPSPRYDEIFQKGQRWLEELAGEEIKECSGEVSFSDEIWKSPTRRESDVS